VLEQKPYKIGKTEYILQQFPATRGLEVGIHLIKIAMGGAKGISSVAGDEDFLDAQCNPAKMAAGIMENVDEKGTPEFIKSIVRESVIVPEHGEGFNDWYETHFSANLTELYDLLAAIIDHNGYMELIKKKLAEVFGIFSSTDGKDPESTPISKGRS